MRKNEETKAAMDFAIAMGLKGYNEAATEENGAMEFAYATGLRHSLGKFFSRNRAAQKAFQPEVSFSFS